MRSTEHAPTRATEIAELALVAMITDLGVSHVEAAQILVREASKHLTPGALTHALKVAS